MSVQRDKELQISILSSSDGSKSKIDIFQEVSSNFLLPLFEILIDFSNVLVKFRIGLDLSFLMIHFN